MLIILCTLLLLLLLLLLLQVRPLQPGLLARSGRAEQL
jgi:hypothetical protein